MTIFNKKPKKSPEEIRKEREEKIAATSKKIRISINNLENKREFMLRKIVEARQKGLAEPERQARNILKQVMASIKRENSMLMTLELAIEARDLAELNASFLESIGQLSDEIIGSGEIISEKETKKVGNKFLQAIFESRQQTERINTMLDVGEYANIVADEDSEQYTEFDDEIDSMLDSFEYDSISMGNQNRTRQ